MNRTITISEGLEARVRQQHDAAMPYDKHAIWALLGDIVDAFDSAPEGEGAGIEAFKRDLWKLVARHTPSLLEAGAWFAALSEAVDELAALNPQEEPTR